MEQKKSSAGFEKELLKEAKERLFQKGVQLTLIEACLFVIFAAVLPLLLMDIFYTLSGYIDAIMALSVIAMIAEEIFLVLPISYAVPMMADRAAKGEEIDLKMLFSSFRSDTYWRSVRVSLFYLLGLLLGFSFLIGTVYGVVTLHAVALATPGAEAFAPYILYPGVILILLSALISYWIYFPFYLVQTHFAAGGKGSCFRMLFRFGHLMKGNVLRYFRIRLSFLPINALSLCLIGALFPIYIIPLSLILKSLWYQRLVAERGSVMEEKQKEDKLLLAYAELQNRTDK